MPAPVKRFYSTADIASILGCSRAYANQLMHMFAYRGQLLRTGRLMRVAVEHFDAWVEEQTKKTREDEVDGCTVRCDPS